MAELNLSDLIEVDDNELATGMGIDTTKLEEEDKANETTTTEEVANTKTKEVDDKDTIEVDDAEIAADNAVTPTGEETKEDLPNPFQAFSLLLKDKGVFPNIEDKAFEKIEDADAIVALLNQQLGMVNNTWKDNYLQQLIPNLVQDGYITPQQVAINEVKLYSAEEVKGNEDLAKSTLVNFYRSKNIPDEQITTIVEGILDHEEEALKVLPLLEEEKTRKNKEVAQRLKDQEQQQLQQQMSFNEQLKTNVNNYKEFIPGRVLTDQDKQDVVTRIPTVLEKINGDLGKYAPILAFLDKYGFMDGKMDKLINEASTKNVSDFEKVLNSKKKGTSNQNTDTRGKHPNTGFSMPQIYK